MADHCLRACLYALKAVEAIGGSANSERDWQLAQLPHRVREWIVAALEIRLKRRL